MSKHVTPVSREQLKDAYDIVLSRWPEMIEAGHKTFHINGGCNMRTLNEIHAPIEEWAVQSEFDSTTGEIIGSVEHYLFTTIHDALKNLSVVRKADLDFEAFASRFDSHPDFRLITSAGVM